MLLALAKIIGLIPRSTAPFFATDYTDYHRFFGSVNLGSLFWLKPIIILKKTFG